MSRLSHRQAVRRRRLQHRDPRRLGELDLADQQKPYLPALPGRNFDQIYQRRRRVGRIPRQQQLSSRVSNLNLLIRPISHQAARTSVASGACCFPGLLVPCGSKLAPPVIAERPSWPARLQATSQAYAIARSPASELMRKLHQPPVRSHDCLRSIMPTNLYGPAISYHPESNHVIRR